MQAVNSRTDPGLIITPTYKAWISAHGDDPYPDWVVARIAELMAITPRERRGTFSASSAGSCLRAQEFAFSGVRPDVLATPSTELKQIFHDGKWRHLKWQADLLTCGLLKHVEFGLDWPNMRSKGSMDGMGIVPDDHPNPAWRGLTFGFELKGVNPFQYPRYVKQKWPTETHREQIARYFLVSGVDLFVVIYENKGTQDFHEWVIAPNKAWIADSEWELRELNNAVDSQTYHPQQRLCAQRTGPFWEKCIWGGKGGVCETTNDWQQTWH